MDCIISGLILGPRIGKYSSTNKKIHGSSFPLAVLGTLILWFGWFGFNGGSNGAMDKIPLILINTFLAASFGLLTGLGISFSLFKKPDPYYVILGPLGVSCNYGRMQFDDVGDLNICRNYWSGNCNFYE